MIRRLVIIGVNSAGLSAAIAARKIDGKADITLISEEKHLPYSRCGLPYVLSGEIQDFKDLFLFPPSYYSMMNLHLLTETTAKSVNPKSRTVDVENEKGRRLIKYDRLLLATGAVPFIPSIKGYDKEGVFTLRSLRDGINLQDAMGKAESAIVVGAGFIGLELAHALIHKRVKTVLIERLPQILPGMFDKELADIVQRKIADKGVHVLVNKTVEAIRGRGKARGVIAGEHELDADLVLLATGVKPRIDLAEQIGVRVGSMGGIRVNPRMESSIPEIYAAGDCVESSSMITGQPVLSQLGTTAERQGKVAGMNMAGSYSAFPGILDSAVSTFFDLEVGVTGFTESAAHQQGFDSISGTS